MLLAPQEHHITVAPVPPKNQDRLDLIPEARRYGLVVPDEAPVYKPGPITEAEARVIIARATWKFDASFAEEYTVYGDGFGESYPVSNTGYAFVLELPAPFRRETYDTRYSSCVVGDGSHRLRVFTAETWVQGLSAAGITPDMGVPPGLVETLAAEVAAMTARRHAACVAAHAERKVELARRLGLAV